jgi:hypothetical protein
MCRRASILTIASLVLGFLLLPAMPAGAATWSGHLANIPTGLDATGTTDVTAQLRAFIDNVPDGSTISFPAGARYRIDGSLIIEDRNHLIFEGNGAEFVAVSDADRNRRHWWIRDSDDITIRDLAVRGANPNAGTGDAAYRSDREAQHGFDFAGVKGALLERVTVTDVYGDFVYIGSGARGLSSDITVRDSDFERNGRQGISITGGEDVRIEHNTISQVRRSTFDIEPNGATWGARRVTITDNAIGPGRLNFIAGHGYAAPVEDIMVSGNRLRGKTMNMSLKAPTSSRRTNFSLIGNVSDTAFGSSSAAITIVGFDGVTIRDNVLPLAARRNMTAVRLASTCGAVVEGNEFANATNEVSRDDYRCPNPGPGSSLTSPSASPTTPADGTSPPASPSTAPRTGSGPPPSGAPAPSAVPGAGPEARSSGTTGAASTAPATSGTRRSDRPTDKDPVDGTAAAPDPGRPLTDNSAVNYDEPGSRAPLWMAMVACIGVAAVLFMTNRLFARPSGEARGRRKRKGTS